MIVTISQLAEALNMSERTLQTLENDGYLPAIKISHRLRRYEIAEVVSALRVEFGVNYPDPEVSDTK